MMPAISNTISTRSREKALWVLLGQRCVEKAGELNFQQIFLESNIKLTPALNLYKNLGFTRIVGEPSPYERCNIQMLLKLQPV